MQRDRTRLISPPYMSPLNQNTVSVIHAECLGRDINAVISVFSGGAWTANLCIYVPLLTAGSIVVSQFWWINGGTVNGNTDIAIYSTDGATRLIGTGATANSGTNAVQAVNVTDAVLPSSSLLWLALGSDSGTQTYFRVAASVQMLDFISIKQQAGGYSSGLPTPITLNTPTVAVLPWFGFTGAAVF